MKAYNLIAILLMATVFIVSCNDDDDGVPRQVTKSYTYDQNLRGSVGVRGELPLPDLRLDDVVEDEIAKNLRRAELQLADSYLEVSGLNQVESPDTGAVVLENFTIKVGSREGVNLGDFSTDPQGVDEIGSDIQLSTNQVISIIQNIFADVTSGSKRAQISVSFTPNVDIDASDNVQLIINFGGIYHYVEVE